MAKIKKIKLPNDNSPRDIVDAGAVRFDEAQSLTDAQKSQARENIAAGDLIAVDSTPSAPATIDADTLQGHAANYFATASSLDNKVDKVSGKGLSTEDYTTAEKQKLVSVNPVVKAVELTAWNQEINAGSATPNITLPAPDTTKVEEITYIFTAATANATFTAPSGWILCNEDGTAGLSAGNSLAYTNLTAGSIYECSFKPISATVIRLVMAETKTA